MFKKKLNPSTAIAILVCSLLVTYFVCEYIFRRYAYHPSIPPAAFEKSDAIIIIEGNPKTDIGKQRESELVQIYRKLEDSFRSEISKGNIINKDDAVNYATSVSNILTWALDKEEPTIRDAEAGICTEWVADAPENGKQGLRWYPKEYTNTTIKDFTTSIDVAKSEMDKELLHWMPKT